MTSADAKAAKWFSVLFALKVVLLTALVLTPGTPWWATVLAAVAMAFYAFLLGCCVMNTEEAS